MEFDVFTHLPAVAPEIGLLILGVVVLALDLYMPEDKRENLAYVSFFGMIALAVTPFIWAPDPEVTEYWGGMVRHDTLAQIFKVMVLLAGAITALLAASTRELAQRGEFYLIIIVSTLGATLMSASADIVMVFIALETTSIPLYILAAFRREDQRSVESGMKYFLFGSFASAIMLYGFSMLYGFAGTTNLQGIAEYLVSGSLGANIVPVVITIVLLFVGFGFKISAVPFHFWTPDVYEGAPTPVTAFVSVASKAASFALLMRFFVFVFPEALVIDGQVVQAFWSNIVIAISVISMTVGNVLALSQRNVKRLLAYSSIAQAGYTLIGVAALTAQSEQSVAAVAYYMFMYTFTNLAAFGVVVLFSEATNSENISDLAGLSRRNSWMALAMTIALLSLAGIPPAAGFFGKFFLFTAAVEANLEWLAIVGVLNALVALYYYLMVVKVMYVDRSPDEDKPIGMGVPARLMLGITVAMVLLLGIVPQPIFDWARESALALFPML